MARSVSLLDYKVEQACFFLEKLSAAKESFFETQCYSDAFVSACRSITFAMQAICSYIEGFDQWYAEQQRGMRKDDLMKFFHQYRTASVHFGDTPTRSGWSRIDAEGKSVRLYYFLPTPDLPSPPDTDVISTCTEYFRRTVRIVLDCYRRFPNDLDDRWHYTKEHFHLKGWTVEDAEESLGFPRGWTGVGEIFDENNRWAMLRKHCCIGCQLNGVFFEYLNEFFAGPDDSN